MRQMLLNLLLLNTRDQLWKYENVMNVKMLNSKFVSTFSVLPVPNGFHFHIFTLPHLHILL